MVKRKAPVKGSGKRAVVGSKRARRATGSGMRSNSPLAAGRGGPTRGGEPSGATSRSEVADLLAIEQLLHRYCHALDRGTMDEVAALFHRDAVLLPVYESDDRYVGRDAVRSWYVNYDKTLRAGVRYLRHKIASPVIEISGDRATSVCYLDADGINVESDEPMIFVGRYEDEIIRDEGRWWFKERRIISYYIYPVGRYLEGRGE